MAGTPKGNWWEVVFLVFRDLLLHDRNRLIWVAGLVAATVSPSPVGVVGTGIVAEIGLKEAATWSEPELESGPESPPLESGSEPEPESESESGSEPESEDGPGATAFLLELEVGSEVTAGVDIVEAVGSVTGIASCSVEELSGAASED